ncbi:MAG: hypothetical protein ABI625_24945 [bacterium]
MTSALQQQTPAPVILSADMSEAAIQLRALVNHQLVATDQLIAAEARLRTITYQVENDNGPSREQGNIVLRNMQGEVRGLKVDLDETRARIKEVRSSMPASPNQAPVGVVGVQERIFDHTVHEVETVFGLLVLVPIVLAATRWIWRRGAGTPARNTFEGGARFDRLEQSVESIAIEVERISEAQRFAAKLLAERHEATPERLRESSRPQRRVATPVP